MNISFPKGVSLAVSADPEQPQRYLILPILNPFRALQFHRSRGGWCCCFFLLVMGWANDSTRFELLVLVLIAAFDFTVILGGNIRNISWVDGCWLFFRFWWMKADEIIIGAVERDPVTKQSEWAKFTPFSRKKSKTSLVWVTKWFGLAVVWCRRCNQGVRQRTRWSKGRGWPRAFSPGWGGWWAPRVTSRCPNASSWGTTTSAATKVPAKSFSAVYKNHK